MSELHLRSRGTIIPLAILESSRASIALDSILSYPPFENYDLDIKREPPKKGKRIAYIGAAIVALVGVTVALSRLEAAPPTVERGSLWIDTVRRGEMVRQVRGPGTLQPEHIRFVSTVTAGRVERVLVRPGATVNAGTVLVELSNPDVQLEALTAEQQLNGAEARSSRCRPISRPRASTRKGVVATTRSDYNEAKRNADVAAGLDTLLSKNDVGKAHDKNVELADAHAHRGAASRRDVRQHQAADLTAARSGGEAPRHRALPGSARAVDEGARRRRRRRAGHGAPARAVAAARNAARQGRTARKAQGRAPHSRDAGEGHPDRSAHADRYAKRDHRLVTYSV